MKLPMNYINDIIPDKIFNKLNELELLDYKRVRDYYLRKKFNELKKIHGSSGTIELLVKEFPDLQPETIKKIIYQK
ncbi:MAG TPA: hypothetical protein PLI27_05205 [Ignavibacteriales bacterium]|nr:hypothetical protein [Ignavibacteriales bacterium]HOM64809.1 hypothetical protein [Ignavibacteriales bacterium]HPD67458.1 hypothetical protein [Ignavibacteriales bacterium]HPP32547.1 hypothetical protein [Ignavibacteriales bacterium]HRR17486.1 hypothetical protein [Ignavibacteriales bacterium]